jgi:hypothetical protein
MFSQSKLSIFFQSINRSVINSKLGNVSFNFMYDEMKKVVDNLQKIKSVTCNDVQYPIAFIYFCNDPLYYNVTTYEDNSPCLFPSKEEVNIVRDELLKLNLNADDKDDPSMLEYKRSNVKEKFEKLGYKMKDIFFVIDMVNDLCIKSKPLIACIKLNVKAIKGKDEIIHVKSPIEFLPKHKIFENTNWLMNNVNVGRQNFLVSSFIFDKDNSNLLEVPRLNMIFDTVIPGNIKANVQ